MSKTKKIILSLSIIIVVLGVSIGLVFYLKSKTKNNKTVAVYSVEMLGYSGDFMGYDSTISGNVAVDKEQKVYLQATDQISEIMVNEGDTVKAGDVLLVYDTTSQQLKLESMRAEVEVARAAVLGAQRDLNILQNTTPVEPTTEEVTTEETATEGPTTEEATTEPITEEVTTEEPTPDTPSDDTPVPDVPQGGENPEETENVQSQVSVAPKAVENLTEPGVPENDTVTYTKEELDKAITDKQNEIKRLNVEYQLKQVELEILEYQTATGEVRCNFDGVVKTVADPEEAILNNEPFIVVSGSDGYTVRGYIGELSLAAVKVGDTVSMYSYDDGMTYMGEIAEISNMPTSDYYSYSGTEETYYPITINVLDADTLSQGMYMEISILDTSSGSDSIYIPMALVDKENGAYYVMKEVDGRLKKVFVQTGKIIWGDTIEIISGVTLDDYLAMPYSKDADEGVKTVHKEAEEIYGY